MNRTMICSPYSGDISRNLAYARLCVRDSFDRREAPFAPHLLYTQPTILDDSIPIERFRGMQAGYEWLQLADVVVFYMDLGWTSGMEEEMKMANLFHKRVEYRYIQKETRNAIADVARQDI